MPFRLNSASLSHCLRFPSKSTSQCLALSPSLLLLFFFNVQLTGSCKISKEIRRGKKIEFSSNFPNLDSQEKSSTVDSIIAPDEMTPPPTSNSEKLMTVQKSNIFWQSASCSLAGSAPKLGGIMDLLKETFYRS